jgi:hypothetical protein
MTELLDKLREERSISLRGGIYHQTQIKFAYHSNRIEGSRLSEVRGYLIDTCLSAQDNYKKLVEYFNVDNI